MSHFVDNLIALARSLRRLGLPIGTDRIITLTEALQHVDLASKEDVRAACRATLIQRHEDIPAFEQVFEDFRIPPARDVDQGQEVELVDEALVLRTWSDLDRIATKDFAELTADELAMVRSALARLTWNIEAAPHAAVGRGPRQPHRSAARARRAAFAPAARSPTLPRRRRRTRRRPIVLLCDVSGSMEHYTRTLLLFAHTLSRGTRDVEAFLFATRLTRITMELRAPKPDAAMAAVSRAVKDWSGGTRIGEALRTFHQRWRRRTLHGSSVVILISDGWDRGDPQLLARRDRAAAPQLPPAGLAQPADRHRRLRAADARARRRRCRSSTISCRCGRCGTCANSRYTWARSTIMDITGTYTFAAPPEQSLGADARSGRDRVVHPGM